MKKGVYIGLLEDIPELVMIQRESVMYRYTHHTNKYLPNEVNHNNKKMNEQKHS